MIKSTHLRFKKRFICLNEPECIKQAPWPDVCGGKIHHGDYVSCGMRCSGIVFFVEEWKVDTHDGYIKNLERLINKCDVLVEKSKVKYTDAQRAAGMHLFKEDVKPFKHRTQRRG